MQHDFTRPPGTDHPLTPLLAPRSIALIGASKRRNTVGNDMLRNLLASGFPGAVHAVNKSYDSLYGIACYPGIAEVPGPVDLAVLAVPNRVIEQVLRECIAAGVRAVTIFGSAELDDDPAPALRDRLAAMAREAGIPLCGANCMGFINNDQPLQVFTSFYPAPNACGGVTYIAQSGSMLTALMFNESRLKFNLAVSTGQELVTTAADYLDYALDQPSTRLVALTLEAIRDVDLFARALRKANRLQIPVVVLKLGRTVAGARMALSHTGAVAGDFAVYDAFLRAHGVIQVRDLQELAATAILLSAGRLPAAGGLGAVLDSGGERELLVDIADDLGVPFAAIGEATQARLAEVLDPGLEPINPVDAWGTGRDFEAVFEQCLAALAEDAQTGMVLFVADLSDGLDLHEGYLTAAEAVARSTAKPVAMLTNYSGWNHQRLAEQLDRAGIPVLDGTVAGLRAVHHAMWYRDFLARQDRSASHPLNPRAAHWRALLAGRHEPLGEDEGYALLADYGLPVPDFAVAETAEAALAAARRIGFPVVLKTAMAGILHKSDVGGVRLGLGDEAGLAGAYAEMAARLGPRVLVCAQSQPGVEMAFGLVRDPSLGNFAMVAMGGTLIEVLRDAQLAPAPLCPAEAAERIAALRMGALLDGVRGAPPANRAALVEAYVALGRIAAELGDCLAEMDINPVFARADGVIAVDNLIVPAGARSAAHG